MLTVFLFLDTHELESAQQFLETAAAQNLVRFYLFVQI